ncbi:hypothetical protein G3M58_93055 [Streptomyces sp. SID7499]|uniref:Uncharacterized protein n=1 Tax=Streptomyces sp. SID7499 TaxID=2706086 RepID=A0A6G3XZB2_9ACTN|nr:hypothetical protein [Streptomyces sp. SID7499]
MTEFRTRLAARVAVGQGAVETHWHVALLRIVRRCRRDNCAVSRASDESCRAANLAK